MNLAPSGAHPLGTDAVEHDELGRLMYGGRVSLLVGLASGLLATVIGTLWGAVPAAQQWIDVVMMRVVDAGIAIPALFILLSVVFRHHHPGLLGGSSSSSAWCPGWSLPSASGAETLRPEGPGLRADTARHRRHARPGDRRHILPNSVSTVVVAATFQVADAILLVAYVFLSAWASNPRRPTGAACLGRCLVGVLGTLVASCVPPGLAIIVVVCAFNALGDLGLRDAST